MKECIERLTDWVARWIGWHLPRKVATHAIDAEYDRRLWDQWCDSQVDPVLSLSTYSDDQLHTFDSSVFGFTEDLP